MMKIKALRASKTPILQAGYLYNNQNNTTTEPNISIELVRFGWGGGEEWGPNFQSTFLEILYLLFLQLNLSNFIFFKR